MSVKPGVTYWPALKNNPQATYGRNKGEGKVIDLPKLIFILVAAIGGALFWTVAILGFVWLVILLGRNDPTFLLISSTACLFLGLLVDFLYDED